jgi:flagellar biosynthetic protein FliO
MVDSGPLLISGHSVAVAAIVIALLAAVAYLLRRASPRGRSHMMSVETALSLGERRSLVIVAVEGRRLLLGMTPTSVGLVAELGPSFGAAFESSLEPSPPMDPLR